MIPPTSPGTTIGKLCLKAIFSGKSTQSLAQYQSQIFSRPVIPPVKASGILIRNLPDFRFANEPPHPALRRITTRSPKLYCYPKRIVQSPLVTPHGRKVFLDVELHPMLSRAVSELEDICNVRTSGEPMMLDITPPDMDPANFAFNDATQMINVIEGMRSEEISRAYLPPPFLTIEALSFCHFDHHPLSGRPELIYGFGTHKAQKVFRFDQPRPTATSSKFQSGPYQTIIFKPGKKNALYDTTSLKPEGN